MEAPETLRRQGTEASPARRDRRTDPTLRPGASKAGLHPHNIYVDDASNERNSTTPVQRQKVIDFIKTLK